MWQADDMANVSLSQYINNPYSYASLLILSSYPSMKTLIVPTTTSVPNPLLTCEITSQFHVLWGHHWSWVYRSTYNSFLQDNFMNWQTSVGWNLSVIMTKKISTPGNLDPYTFNFCFWMWKQKLGSKDLFRILNTVFQFWLNRTTTFCLLINWFQLLQEEWCIHSLCFGGHKK